MLWTTPSSQSKAVATRSFFGANVFLAVIGKEAVVELSRYLCSGILNALTVRGRLVDSIHALNISVYYKYYTLFFN